ncbi:MAG: hypothetical protein ACI88H_000676 [Cocleimonas sp.]|jgi:hypothetical protein
MDLGIRDVLLYKCYNLGESMAENWTFEDFKANNFFHTQSENDAFKLLEQAESAPLFEDLKVGLLCEARTVFEVSSLPFFVAFLAAGMSQTKLIEELNRRSKEEHCTKSAEVAKFIFDNSLYTTAISAVIPTFQALDKADLVSAHIDKLNNSIVMNAYGCLEKHSKFLLKEIMITDLNKALDYLHGHGLVIGKSKAERLKNCVDSDFRDPNNGLSLSDAYDENILNKGYNIEQYTNLFMNLTDVIVPDSTVQNLKKMESLRHILIHKNGIVDQKYIDEVDSSLTVNDRIVLSPDEMHTFMEAFVDYFANVLAPSENKF